MSDTKFNINKLSQETGLNDSTYFFKYMKVDEVSGNQFKQLEEMLSDGALPICASGHEFNQWVILKQILVHRMIYLGRYTYLNDPFECITNIDYSNGVDDKIISKYHAVASPRIAETAPQYQLTLSQLKEKISRHKVEMMNHLYHPALLSNNPLPFGVYSLCEDPDNIQMWSYYGGSHGGVCIAFKIDWTAIISRLKAQHQHASLETIKIILINHGFKFDYIDKHGEVVRFGFQKVCYSPGVVSYPANQFMMAHYEQAWADDFSWVLTGNKAIGSNHETEWRLTSFNRYSESSDDLLPLSVFDFLKPCGIILGASMKQDIKNMVKKCYGQSYPIFELAPTINNGVLSYSLAPNKAHIIAALDSDVSVGSNHQDVDIESTVNS
jgi:hypothetical protein